jgi:Rad/Gem-related GTP binding protein 1
MAVSSPGTYPVSPRSPKSPILNSPAASKSSSHFNFVPPKSPGGPKSPNHYCPKIPGASKSSTHFNFGPKSPGAPKSPTNFNCGPKSPGGPKSSVNFNVAPKRSGRPDSPRQQFVFGPKSPGSSKSSSKFTFGPKSPVGPRSPNATPRSPNGYNRSSSIGTQSPSSRAEGSIRSFSSNASISSSAAVQNSIAGSTHDVNSTDTASTSSSYWTRYRRSTSDLTDLMEEDCSTASTSLSRPCSPRSRAGSIKGGGGLAYLASRRGSRDSQLSQASAEDVGPLNFSGNPRGSQRRKSNFLELPGNPHAYTFARSSFGCL